MQIRFACFSTNGWRLGVQSLTGVVLLSSLLGTFYRSASLYHPQRRAILHLKSQKRKIKNKDKEKNKIQDDAPPFFDFTCLRSRTIQILLLSIFVASIGLSTTFFFMVIKLKFIHAFNFLFVIHSLSKRQKIADEIRKKFIQLKIISKLYHQNLGFNSNNNTHLRSQFFLYDMIFPFFNIR